MSDIDVSVKMKILAALKPHQSALLIEEDGEVHVILPRGGPAELVKPGPSLATKMAIFVHTPEAMLLVDKKIHDAVGRKILEQATVNDVNRKL